MTEEKIKELENKINSLQFLFIQLRQDFDAFVSRYLEDREDILSYIIELRQKLEVRK